jgi:SAM-dependent methyltransferase
MKRRPLPRRDHEEERLLAQIWANADRAETDALFLRLLRELQPGELEGKQVLALGGWPGPTPIGFLKAWPKARCDLVDPSPARMETLAQALEALPGVARRYHPFLGGISSASLPRGAYDLVLSPGLLHRLDDPLDLWRTIQRVARPGVPILVMDLMRPPSPGWLESLVATYVPANLQEDFRAALFAAYEPAEVQAQLELAGLPDLEVIVVSDRHLAVRRFFA